MHGTACIRIAGGSSGFWSRACSRRRRTDPAALTIPGFKQPRYARMLIQERQRICWSPGGMWSAKGERTMFKHILVPVDIADAEFAKPAIGNAIEMARTSGGTVRLVNVLPMTPVMLAEYVPPDFDVQQRQAAEEAL